MAINAGELDGVVLLYVGCTLAVHTWRCLILFQFVRTYGTRECGMTKIRVRTAPSFSADGWEGIIGKGTIGISLNTSENPQCLLDVMVIADIICYLIAPPSLARTLHAERV